MTRYRIPAHVLRAPLAGEEVLLDTRSELYHHLRGCGRQVVEALERDASASSVAEEIARETGEDVARVQADTEAFIATMVHLGLLEDVGA